MGTLTKDEYISALEKDNARKSRLLAISRAQVEKLRTKCEQLQDANKELMSNSPIED